MSRNIQRQWAQEMMLEFIDEKIKDELNPEGYAWNLEDYVALKKQRNRIAKFFGLPEKISSNKRSNDGQRNRA
jgi:hypothetical protein